MLTVADSAYWEDRYQQGTTRWDLGQATPPFVSFLNQSAIAPPGRVIVLGCGSGYEVMLFAEHGFEVTGVDFAPSAIARASAALAKADRPAQLLQRDIFSLLPEFAGTFDYVVEHTCFCAIAPEQRSAYVELVHGLLRPQGQVLGLFFTHDRPGGPPFGSTPAEILQLFQPNFKILELASANNSVPERQGEEHWGRFERRVIHQ
jgi:methyl halide transferase